MNYYSAHLFIDVHCSLKQKKKKIIQPDLIVSIFYSFYQIRSFVHSHSLFLVHCHLSSQASQAHSLDVAAIVKFTPVSQAHSLNVASPTIVNVAAIIKFRPTSPICLKRTSLPPIHFRSVVSVFFM